MMLIEKLENLDILGQKHTQKMRTGAPVPFARPGWRSERKGSYGNVGDIF
jgi:hypothetical protein